MAENELYPVRGENHTLVLTPNGDEPHFVLDYTRQGEEYVGFMFKDPQAGPALLAFATRAVPHVIDGLQSVLDNLDQCRADWRERNGDTHE